MVVCENCVRTGAPSWSSSGSSAISGHSVGGPSAKLTGSRKPVVEHLKHKYYAKPLRSSPSRGCRRGCRTAIAVPKSVVSTSFAMYPDFLSLSRSAPSN